MTNIKDGYQEYLEALKEWGKTLEDVTKSYQEMRKLTEQTSMNTKNLIKELNKRGAEIVVEPADEELVVEAPEPKSND